MGVYEIVDLSKLIDSPLEFLKMDKPTVLFRLFKFSTLLFLVLIQFRI